MARSLNKAILIGNLGADPEVRTTGSGTRVAQFSVATGRSWTDAEGNAHERTEWHRVVVWGSRVDVVEQYLRKGERVYVEGEIQYRSYEDGEGVTRYVTEINARDFLFLGGRQEERAEREEAEAEVSGPVTVARAPKPAPASPKRAPGRRTPAGAASPETDDLPF